MTPSMKCSAIKHAINQTDIGEGGMKPLSELSRTQYVDCIARIREIVGAPEKGRKIVGIATVIDERAASEALYALCEDGSVHYGWWDKGVFEWRNTVPPVDIPQDTPAEAPDPIAELEAMGGTIGSDGDCGWGVHVDGAWLFESLPAGGQLVDLRAAAARLLARVKGASNG